MKNVGFIALIVALSIMPVIAYIPIGMTASEDTVNKTVTLRNVTAGFFISSICVCNNGTNELIYWGVMDHFDGKLIHISRAGDHASITSVSRTGLFVLVNETGFRQSYVGYGEAQPVFNGTATIKFVNS